MRDPRAPEIAQSRAWCRRFLRSHTKSFYLATRFLPRAKREAIEAAYSLFRVVDELADAPGLAREDRKQGLSAIASAIERVRDQNFFYEAPWFYAVRGAFGRFRLSIEDALRLVAACRSEIDGVTCKTMDDLRAYASEVGGAIVRFAMPVLGATDGVSLARAERLGIALNLTDVVRDVEEDRAAGRRYLPAELAGLPDRGIGRIVAEAREYYREAPLLAKRLPNDGSRLAVLVTASLYEGLLDGPLPLRGKVRRVASCIVRSYLG